MRFRAVVLGMMVGAVFGAPSGTTDVRIEEDFRDLDAWSVMDVRGTWSLADGAAHGEGHAWLSYEESVWRDLDVQMALAMEQGSRLHVNQRNGADRVYASIANEGTLRVGMSRGHDRNVVLRDDVDSFIDGSEWAVRFESFGDTYVVSAAPLGLIEEVGWEEAVEVDPAAVVVIEEVVRDGPDEGQFALEIIGGEIDVFGVAMVGQRVDPPPVDTAPPPTEPPPPTESPPIETVPPPPLVTAPPTVAPPSDGGGGIDWKTPAAVGGGAAAVVIGSRAHRARWRRHRTDEAQYERCRGRCQPGVTCTQHDRKPDLKARTITAVELKHRVDGDERTVRIDDGAVVGPLGKALWRRRLGDDDRSAAQVRSAAAALAGIAEERLPVPTRAVVSGSYEGSKGTATVKHYRCGGDGSWPDTARRTWTATVTDQATIPLGTVDVGSGMATALVPLLLELVRSVNELETPVPHGVEAEAELKISF